MKLRHPAIVVAIGLYSAAALAVDIPDDAMKVFGLPFAVGQHMTDQDAKKAACLQTEHAPPKHYVCTGPVNYIPFFETTNDIITAVGLSVHPKPSKQEAVFQQFIVALTKSFGMPEYENTGLATWSGKRNSIGIMSGNGEVTLRLLANRE